MTVSGGGTKQMREIRSGGSFLSQNDLRAYFGLGDYAGPVDVEIRMPGGRRWEWKQLPSDRLHELTLSDSASHPASRHCPMSARVRALGEAAPARGPLVDVALLMARAQVEDRASYRPELAVSEALEPFLKQLEPGTDAFPLERQAQELDARLRELSDALRGGGARDRRRHQEPARSRLPRRSAASRSETPRRVKRALEVKQGEGSAARGRRSTLARLARSCGG